MKYVEAMILNQHVPAPSVGNPAGEFDKADTVSDAVDRARIAIDSENDAEIKAALVALEAASDALLSEVDDHDCADHVGYHERTDEIPLVPVSHPDSIRRQLETSGFNRGDLVAIVGLSDLEALMDERIALRNEAIK